MIAVRDEAKGALRAFVTSLRSDDNVRAVYSDEDVGELSVWVLLDRYDDAQLGHVFQARRHHDPDFLLDLLVTPKRSEIPPDAKREFER